MCLQIKPFVTHEFRYFYGNTVNCISRAKTGRLPIPLMMKDKTT